MILKGSQRGRAGDLARHLLRTDENDHVELLEVRGFMAQDLHGALAEAHAVSKGTQCRQFMFSLSINPPKDGEASLEALTAAADRAEEALGLNGQPRAIVVHEKNARRHVHVVWSRIDATEMKAINLPFFKTRLAGLSKELYLEHGWPLPEGHRENGWKNPLNFTLAEWQQARRLDLDPRELKELFRDAWQHSDSGRAFKAALEDRGYYIARGDRRGFVAVDLQGEVFSLTRMTGAKSKELEARLGSPGDLPGVEQARADNADRLDRRGRDHLKETGRARGERLKPLLEERARMTARQRLERERQRRGQDRRWIEETMLRQSRMRSGIRGVLDILIGRAAAIRRFNEQETFLAWKRDRAQREELFTLHMAERVELQRRLDHAVALGREQVRSALRNALRLLSSPSPEPAPRREARRRGRGGLELDF